MANPNIVNVTTITGKTDVLLVTTSATAITSNSAASGKVLKINSLIISNINTASADITIDLYRSSVAYRLIKSVTVPAGTSLYSLVKDSIIYLQEGDSLRLTASANSYLEGVCSYEDIS